MLNVSIRYSASFLCTEGGRLSAQMARLMIRSTATKNMHMTFSTFITANHADNSSKVH